MRHAAGHQDQLSESDCKDESTRMADGGPGRLPASPLARGEDPCLCPLTLPSNTTLSPPLPIVHATTMSC